MRRHLLSIVLLPVMVACSGFGSFSPPAPYGPLPSAQQLAWHELEFYAFVHFNMNTFTGREWGEGTESPALFDPSELDARQWARVARDAGMKGIILTAKHHDGFCLWPSRLTDHTVAASPWRDGQGDVLRELSAACREFDLRFGVYLSPWDRHEPSYGDSPRYNAHFIGQLEEVLSGYGPVFEVWFDGACGEGPNGKRQVYDWPAFIETVRRLQPGAVIFSDAGPDVRWVGNEQGYAGETNWTTLKRDELEPGTPRYRELTEGHRDGAFWVPSECDVSIRPGWYYHPEQDDQVKIPQRLLDIWFGSVGRGSNLLLNLPVDRRGRVHENDVAALMGLRALLDSLFAIDLANAATATASNVRGDHPRFAPANVLDGDPATYWATDDGVRTPDLTVTFPALRRISIVRLEEYIALGQRVEAFGVDAWVDGAWRDVAAGTTIGPRRILRFEPVRTDRLRIRIIAAAAPPVLSEVKVYGIIMPPPRGL
jgi:alpha-L-fucosidase